MTIGARVSSGGKREAEADAAFRTVKIARSGGPDRGRKAHDKERQVIEKTKTDNKKRRARSISLRAENLRLKEELRRMSVRSEDLLELWRQLETALQTLDKKGEEIKKLMTDLEYEKDDLREARCALSAVTDGADLAATTLWKARELDRISYGSRSRMGRRLWRAFEDWRRDHGSEDDSRSP